MMAVGFSTVSHLPVIGRLHPVLPNVGGVNKAATLFTAHLTEGEGRGDLEDAYFYQLRAVTAWSPAVPPRLRGCPLH